MSYRCGPNQVGYIVTCKINFVCLFVFISLKNVKFIS